MSNVFTHANVQCNQYGNMGNMCENVYMNAMLVEGWWTKSRRFVEEVALNVMIEVIHEYVPCDGPLKMDDISTPMSMSMLHV